MAAYIPVPRDLTRVKSKIFFNLTKRQLICFGAGALMGVPSFFLLKRIGSTSLAAMGMILIMLPMFPLVIAAAGGGWFYVQTKKKKQAVNTPDPDADYTDDDENEDYGAGEDDANGDDNVVVVSDTGSDPYEDEILADDGDDPEEV